jgi:frataxin-like iron-binding protein CyaY
MILKQFLQLTPGTHAFQGQRVNGALLATNDEIVLTYSEPFSASNPHVVATLEVVNPWVRENVRLPEHLDAVVQAHLDRKADFEARQENRADRLEAGAERSQAEAEAHRRRSDSAVAGIPMGQPILVGHHSERRHRKALDHSHNAMRSSVEADQKARYLKGRAASVGSGGVSSDDPDARFKLQEELDGMAQAQERMKAANKLVRKGDRAGLVALGFSEKQADSLLKPDFAGRLGFPSYALQNNNANMRRLQKRIEELKAVNQIDDFSHQYGEHLTLELDSADNRVRLVIDHKPEREIRQHLKRSGFNFSRANEAWQRKATANGIAAAKRTAEFLKDRL